MNHGYDDVLKRLAASKFRSGFKLSAADARYVSEKGRDVVRSHACDFVAGRLAPAHPKNDGKQTPMKGHPVFKAMHACACCCRGCLEKWHGVSQGRPLTTDEQSWIVGLLMAWLEQQMTAQEELAKMIVAGNCAPKPAHALNGCRGQERLPLV